MTAAHASTPVQSASVGRIDVANAAATNSSPTAAGSSQDTTPCFTDRLVVVSCAMHYHWQGEYHAYAPYTREMDQWSHLFSELVIAAPLTEAEPPADCAPFAGANVRVVRQRTLGGETVGAKLRQLCALPWICRDLVKAFRQGDAIHVRCPGNLSLPAIVLAPIFSRRLVAKYAGQWSGYPQEPFTYAFQRWLLRSRWWNGPVTVYGHWPHQPHQIVPFFTSVMTGPQVDRARMAARDRRLNSPLRLLYVGRLVATKHVDALLQATASLAAEGVAVATTIVGDGPDRATLMALANSLGIADLVYFTGALAYEAVLDCYERADVLVLVSESEGWPKAVAEAMAFGLLCIGSDHGFVAEMLGDGRGMVVPSRDGEALVAALRRVAANPDAFAEYSIRAAQWAQRFSLEGLRDALAALLRERWSTPSGEDATVSRSEIRLRS